MLVTDTSEWPLAGDTPFPLSTGGREPPICILSRELVTYGLNAGPDHEPAGSPGAAGTQPVPSMKAQGPGFRQAPPTTAP